jgi:hypothetical protein
MKKGTNWDLLLSENVKQLMKDFANKEISGRTVSSALKNTEYAGEFRSLIRTKGVEKAQDLTRRALKRRCG